MIPHAAGRQMLNRLPPEFRPYVRRVLLLILAAAIAGAVLALIIPGGHGH